MGKILFVSTTPISLKTFDGKEKRALSILKSLSKSNKIDIVCIDQQLNKKKIRFCNQEIRFKINFFLRIFNTIFSLVRLQPLQNGYFFSKQMFSYIEQNKNDYDTMIFHLIRSCQYLPSDFYGKTILEMTDLVSVRDEQIIQNLKIINPLKYLYMLERFLIKRYEKNISNKFDKVVFISTKELYQAKKFIDKDKIQVIENFFNPESKIYKFSKKNNKIVFLGNINYLPNKLACHEFSKKILPEINKKYPEVSFHIVGKINLLDKLFFKLHKNVKVHGPIANLKTVFKESICGICNVKIATGFQNKILNYMSFGIPAITSKESFDSSLFRKNKDVYVYSTNEELVKLIFSLKENKKISNKLSKNSYQTLKNKFSPLKIFIKYRKIVK